MGVRNGYKLSTFVGGIVRFVHHNEKLSIFMLLFIMYNLNFRLIPSGDTIPASLLPFSILDNHNLYLDYFFQDKSNIPYFIVEMKGHLLSFFPVVVPVLLTPIYAIPYLILKLINYPIDIQNPGFFMVVMIMEKLSASMIATFSGIFIFLALKELMSKKIALVGTIIFAFATNTWAVSSQTLWQHGMVELLLSMMIYLVIINEKSKSNQNIIYLGILSGFFIFNRPPDSVLLLPILFYVIYSVKSQSIRYFSFMVFASIPFLLYNLYFFGTLFGGYAQNLNILTLNMETLSIFIGLLFSPNRGLFVYSPILILSIFGYLNIPRIENRMIRYFLFMFGFSVLLNIVVYSSFETHWWGGHSYGPRFLLGTVPMLVILLCLALPRTINFSHLYKDKNNLYFLCIFSVLLLFSFFVQIVGAFYYPNGEWNENPNIDQNPERLWYWNDTQILRTFHAGPIMPKPLNNLGLITRSKGIEDIKDKNIILAYGWHPLQLWNDIPVRWMENNGTFNIYSPSENDVTISLNVNTFTIPRVLQVSVNDELEYQTTVSSWAKISAKVNFSKGENIVRFYTPDGCQRPIDNPQFNNKDSRCLSILFQNIKII